MPIIELPHDARGELIGRRTLRSKEFDLGRGMRRLVHKLGRVHYHDDNHKLQDIELTTEVDDDGNIIADKLPYRFRVHQDGIGLDYQSRADGGNVSLRLDQVGTRAFNRGKRHTAVRQDNLVTFADVADGLDIVFEITRFGVRTYRILKHAQAERSWRWEIEHDEIGGRKIQKDRIVGQDATERRVSASLRHTDAVPIGPGRHRYFSTETWDGHVEHTDPHTRIRSLRQDAVYPVAIDPDVTETIAADADDGHEKSGATGWVSNVTLDNLGKYNYYYDPAWRFTTVAVTPGTTIVLANLIIKAVSNTVGGGGGKIYGYNTNSAAALSGTVKPSTMAKTTAFTTLTASTSTGLRTYDVTTAVAEIVARGGWASGNNITLFAKNNGAGGYNRTRFEDYSNAGTSEARLEITFPASGQPTIRRFGMTPYAATTLFGNKGVRIF